jgi:hypothetical protein
MDQVSFRCPFSAWVGLAACLLFTCTNAPAEALSGEGSGIAAATEDGTAVSPSSPWSATNGFWSMTDTGPDDSDLPQSSAAEANSSKSKD